MKVAALYDVHGMPWALEAVLAEVDARMRSSSAATTSYGPCPRETVALIRVARRARAARQLRGPGRGLGTSELAAGDLEWLQSLPLAATVDGVLYCHAAPDDNTPITTAITPDDAVHADLRRTTRERS